MYKRDPFPKSIQFFLGLRLAFSRFRRADPGPDVRLRGWKRVGGESMSDQQAAKREGRRTGSRNGCSFNSRVNSVGVSERGRTGARKGGQAKTEANSERYPPGDPISTPSRKNIRASSDLRKKSRRGVPALLISCFAPLRAPVPLGCPRKGGGSSRVKHYRILGTGLGKK